MSGMIILTTQKPFSMHRFMKYALPEEPSRLCETNTFQKGRHPIDFSSIVKVIWGWVDEKGKKFIDFWRAVNRYTLIVLNMAWVCFTSIQVCKPHRQSRLPPHPPPKKNHIGWGSHQVFCQCAKGGSIANGGVVGGGRNSFSKFSYIVILSTLQYKLQITCISYQGSPEQA